MDTTSCVIFLKSYKQDILGRDIKEIEKNDYNLRAALIPFLPENALDEVVAMLQKYSIHLHIVPCISIRRCPPRGLFSYGYSSPHSIYIKNDLDKDTFLQVFLHEYAHLLTHLSFPHSGSHNYEFYFCFCKLIREFFQKKIISEDSSYFNFKGSLFLNNRSHNEILALVSGAFYLKTIRVDSQFEYNKESFVRGKGQQGKIRCVKLSDNMIFRLEPDTQVEPILDLIW